jgi:hypothetical protein
MLNIDKYQQLQLRAVEQNGYFDVIKKWKSFLNLILIIIQILKKEKR